MSETTPANDVTEKVQNPELLEAILNGTDDCVVGDDRIVGAINSFFMIHSDNGLEDLSDEQFAIFNKFFDEKLTEEYQKEFIAFIVFGEYIRYGLTNLNKENKNNIFVLPNKRKELLGKMIKEEQAGLSKCRKSHRGCTTQAVCVIQDSSQDNTCLDSEIEEDEDSDYGSENSEDDIKVISSMITQIKATFEENEKNITEWELLTMMETDIKNKQTRNMDISVTEEDDDLVEYILGLYRDNYNGYKSDISTMDVSWIDDAFDRAANANNCSACIINYIPRDRDNYCDIRFQIIVHENKVVSWSSCLD